MANSGLQGKQFKYLCMLTGEKAGTPCKSCYNPKGCISRAMQYKEHENMAYSENDDENVVKVDDTGKAIGCAKDYGIGTCGYTAGSKVCGKCGALAVEVKADPMDNEDDLLFNALEEKATMLDEVSEAEAEKRRIEKATRDISDAQNEDDESGDFDHGDHNVTKAKGENAADSENEWVGLDAEEKAGVMMRESRLPRPRLEDDEEEEEEETPTPPPPPPPGAVAGPAPMAGPAAAPEDAPPPPPPPPPPMAEGPPPGDVGPPPRDVGPPPGDVGPPPGDAGPPPGVDRDEELAPRRPPPPMVDEEDEELPPRRPRMMDKEEEEEYNAAYAKKAEGAYLCAIDRKVYPGNATVCEDCPGGCVSEKGMPGLLEVEASLELQFKGAEFARVIDSVYSERADLFIADLDIDGEKVIEVFVEGQTGEVLGYNRLDDSVFEHKSAFEEVDLIDFNEAAEIAVKTIEGAVSAVEPDVFEGYDCYAVEINAMDSKSYDVFVALDGEVLGYDAYEPDETEAIEAEAAEIALKRAFSSDQREELAKEGKAMKDGSYPIDSEQDLRNAVQAYGRASNKPATKAHIMKRARAMGLEEVIPANWVGGNEKAIMSVDDADFMTSLIEFELLSEEDSNVGSL